VIYSAKKQAKGLRLGAGVFRFGGAFNRCKYRIRTMGKMTGANDRDITIIQKSMDGRADMCYNVFGGSRYGC
jgi:hypothetical protein